MNKSFNTAYEQILQYSASSSSDAKNITATAGATNSFTGGYGTEIKGSQQISGLLYTGSYPNLSLPSTAYVTLFLKSTDYSTLPVPNLYQHFRGTYIISSAANGGGHVYVVGTDILGTIDARNGAATLDLQTTTNPAPSYDPNTGLPVVATGGVLDGELIHDPFTGDEYYTNAFDIQLGLAHVLSLGTGSSGGNRTVVFTSANLGFGSVSAYVPEPSTFSLLGLGAAGVAISAYRRRKAAAA